MRDQSHLPSSSGSLTISLSQGNGAAEEKEMNSSSSIRVENSSLANNAGHVVWHSNQDHESHTHRPHSFSTWEDLNKDGDTDREVSHLPLIVQNLYPIWTLRLHFPF